MKDILNKLGIQDIGADRYYTECPRCAKSRKKINSKSLLVVKEGDIVTIRECRPLSKTKSWTLVAVVESAS